MQDAVIVMNAWVTVTLVGAWVILVNKYSCTLCGTHVSQLIGAPSANTRHSNDVQQQRDASAGVAHTQTQGVQHVHLDHMVVNCSTA